jgi:hypothetical protein
MRAGRGARFSADRRCASVCDRFERAQDRKLRFAIGGPAIRRDQPIDRTRADDGEPRDRRFAPDVIVTAQRGDELPDFRGGGGLDDHGKKWCVRTGRAANDHVNALLRRPDARRHADVVVSPTCQW